MNVIQLKNLHIFTCIHCRQDAFFYTWRESHLEPACIPPLASYLQIHVQRASLWPWLTFYTAIIIIIVTKYTSFSVESFSRKFLPYVDKKECENETTNVTYHTSANNIIELAHFWHPFYVPLQYSVPTCNNHLGFSMSVLTDGAIKSVKACHVHSHLALKSNSLSS